MFNYNCKSCWSHWTALAHGCCSLQLSYFFFLKFWDQKVLYFPTLSSILYLRYKRKAIPAASIDCHLGIWAHNDIFLYKNLALTLTTQEKWLEYCALKFQSGNRFMYDLPRQLLCVAIARWTQQVATQLLFLFFLILGSKVFFYFTTLSFILSLEYTY